MKKKGGDNKEQLRKNTIEFKKPVIVKPGTGNNQSASPVKTNAPDRPTSLPFVIRVKNSSDSVEKISLFGNVGNYKERNNSFIHLSCGSPGVEYIHVLYQLLSHPCKIGMIYFHIISGDTGKVYKYASVIEAKTMDCNGSTVTIPIVSPMDPYQVLEKVWISEKEFSIDGMTEVNFKMPPDSELQMFFYPVEIRIH